MHPVTDWTDIDPDTHPSWCVRRRKPAPWHPADLCGECRDELRARSRSGLTDFDIRTAIVSWGVVL